MAVRQAELDLQALMQAGERAEKLIREWPVWKQQVARATCGFANAPESSNQSAACENHTSKADQAK